MKNWYSIKNLDSAEVAEVSIHAEIGFWGINAEQFIKDFRAITAPTVRLSINSPGGSVFDALAMFNAIRASGKNIEVTVLGIAASAASYLAMAGDKITMPDNTFMFIHNPINGVYGNADDMREMADILDKLGASLLATYAKRWKGTEQEMQAAFDAESYLTAAECLELGLCDEVTPSIEAKAKFDVENLPANIQALFKPTAAAPSAALDAPPLAEVIRAHAEQAGLAEYAATFAADPTATSEAAALAVIRNARETAALCAVAGLPDRAGAFIKSRAALPAVRQQLAEALAEADAELPINTAAPAARLSGPAAPDFNPTDLWKQINAMQRSKK